MTKTTAFALSLMMTVIIATGCTSVETEVTETPEVEVTEVETTEVETTEVETTEVETTEVETTEVSQKSFVEYYETRFDSETLGEDNSFLMKTPEELGFKEIAKTKIACPENPDGPCGGDLLILSKESLHSGDQEFYLEQAGGAGYTYFGPFTDDLERIVAESKLIEELKEGGAVRLKHGDVVYKIQTYSDENYSFEYPENYQVMEDIEPNGIEVRAADGKLSIFQLKSPSGERVNAIGFGPDEGPVPEQIKVVENDTTWFDVWFYYDTGDQETEEELKAIFDSIELK